jgi:nicotinamide-nucleotide amidase
MMREANPTLGLAAHTGQVDVRVAARAETPEAAESLLDAAEARVRAAIGEYVYTTTPGEAYETVLVRRLAERNLRIAIAETNTQGELAVRLQKALSEYDPVAKTVVLSEDQPENTPKSGVGDQISDSDQRRTAAIAAAQALVAEGAAPLGLALVGTYGADEGVFGAGQGETWLALTDGQQVDTARIGYGGTDDYTTVRIGNQALRALWKFVG